MYDRIYLVGFMGCGKSTTGKKIARMLGWDFTDLDKVIEANSGHSISEIFSRYGEEYFRKTEAAALDSVKDGKNRVIATGGGAPCHDNNMALMNSTGLTVYLRMTPAQLASRLQKSRGKRPLLAGIPDCELESFIRSKLATREKWYLLSELILDGFDPDIKSIIRRAGLTENPGS